MQTNISVLPLLYINVCLPHQHSFPMQPWGDKKKERTPIAGCCDYIYDELQLFHLAVTLI